MKIYEHIEDEKLQLQFKFELNLSYRKKLENLYGEQTRAGISCPKYFGNFFNPKWVKLILC
jgi:hypothetical protein